MSGHKPFSQIKRKHTRPDPDIIRQDNNVTILAPTATVIVDLNPKEN